MCCAEAAPIPSSPIPLHHHSLAASCTASLGLPLRSQHVHCGVSPERGPSWAALLTGCWCSHLEDARLREAAGHLSGLLSGTAVHAVIGHALGEVLGRGSDVLLTISRLSVKAAPVRHLLQLVGCSLVIRFSCSVQACDQVVQVNYVISCFEVL